MKSFGSFSSLCSETDYWLELLGITEYLDSKTTKELGDDCSEINRMLSSIVKTTKEKLYES